MRIAVSFLVVSLCLAGVVHGEESKKPAGESVEFNGQELLFAFEGKNPGEQFKEYIPEGEDLESWTSLASIREYPNIDDPVEFAQRMAALLKRQNPSSQSAIIQNPKTGNVVIDFITWPSDQKYVEFNVFKIERRSPHGLTAQQFAVRDYGHQLEFLKNLKPLREKLCTTMIDEGLKVNGSDAR